MTNEFRYAEKNAAKIAEEQKIQAEIDEEKSRELFFILTLTSRDFSFDASDQQDQSFVALQIPQSSEKDFSFD